MNALFKGKGDKKVIRNKVAKAIIPHHIADWDISTILKDYKHVYDCLSEGCEGQDTLNYIIGSKNAEGKKCGRKRQPCKTLLATISNENNPFGYLLGLCDMISQAGREAPELSSDASDLGIEYGQINNCVDSRSGSLKIGINYTKKEGKTTKETVLKYFKTPALYLGLQWPEDHESVKNSLFLKIKRYELFLYNPRIKIKNQV